MTNVDGYTLDSLLAEGEQIQESLKPSSPDSELDLVIKSYEDKCVVCLAELGQAYKTKFKRAGNSGVACLTCSKYEIVTSYLGMKIDCLVEISEAVETRSISSNTIQSDKIFNELAELVSQSSLAEAIQSVIHYDLDEARKAYSASAFKACVVMLGAALEGMMLGTLRRSDVIQYFCDNPEQAPNKIKELSQGIGLRSPMLAERIANIQFEQMMHCINHLIGGIQNLGADDIQDFRNSIHPSEALADPLKYHDDFYKDRALQYLASLRTIADVMLSYFPPA